MKRAGVLALWIGLLGAMALLPGCGDDPVRPGSAGPWQETTLGAALPGGAIIDIAFSATRGMAVGAVATGAQPDRTFTPFLLSRQAGGTWVSEPGVSLPVQGMLTAVGMSPSGQAAVAGVDYGLASGFILDERGGWSRHSVASGLIAFAASGDTLRFGGVAVGSQPMLVSTAGDVWTAEALPFPGGSGEHGIQDLTARNGHWVACGFDDGAEGTPASPNSVLFRNDGSGWERIDVSCGGCSNREFQSVGVSAAGGILLGGSTTDFAGGAHRYTASLLLRSVTGSWVEIVLPAADELRTVNDILLAQDGTLYMACGMDSTFIVRWPPGGAIQREAVLSSARVNRLAEAPDGSVWAAGAILTAAGEVQRPAIWKRTG